MEAKNLSLIKVLQGIRKYHAQFVSGLSEYLDLNYCLECGNISAYIRFSEGSSGFELNRCRSCQKNGVSIFRPDCLDGIMDRDITELIKAVDRKAEQLCSGGYDDEGFLSDVNSWSKLSIDGKRFEFETAYQLLDDLDRAKEKVLRLKEILGIV